LAALTAIVVPRLDFLKAQADHASAATNLADLTSLLQTYKTSSGKYPAMDLLVDSAGTAYTQMWSFDGTSPFTGTTITGPGAPGASDWYRSFLEGGLATGYYNDSTATDATNGSDTASDQVDLVNGAAAGNLVVAELTTSSTNPYVPAIFANAFPSTNGVPPVGVKLIAMGIGARNGMNGSTMLSTPVQADDDSTTATYCRYIAIFAIYQDGTAAQLKTVVDHRLKQIDKQIDQFNKGGPST
ncbi:MAG TPA: hypothetical protein VFE24_10755, partial [Pirellulales bacterium]|nr:hypothetical protein [Pirellulales bacterium]